MNRSARYLLLLLGLGVVIRLGASSVQESAKEPARPAPASAADLNKVDRTIAREPVYQSKPRYCLLVFGPEAKTRVWLVVDGDVLYVDRNGNGDLTEGDERCMPQQLRLDKRWHDYVIGDIIDLDGRTKYTDLRLRAMKGGEARVSVRAYRDHEQHTGYDDGSLRFADRPQIAPIVHFAGPLSIRARPFKLVRGKTEAEIWAEMGTPGRGEGTFAWVWDWKISLVAEMEFPGSDPRAERIKLKVSSNGG